MGADRELMLLAPERLEQAGAGAKAGVAGLEHAVAAQDVLRDEGKMTKGVVGGGRHRLVSAAAAVDAAAEVQEGRREVSSAGQQHGAANREGVDG